VGINNKEEEKAVNIFVRKYTISISESDELNNVWKIHTNTAQCEFNAYKVYVLRIKQ
jgi:hypothetical protein